MIMEGFYLRCCGREIFVKTSQKNKTEKFAEKVLTALYLPITPENVKVILFRLTKAKCELKRTSNGKEYYDIYGENFSGYGDDKTIIIEA